MAERMTVKRLTRLALQYAIEDRVTYSQCDQGDAGRRALEDARDFKALLEGRPTQKAVEEVTRLAFIYAQQEREGFADSDPGEHGQLAAALAKRFRDHRRAVFGRTKWEAIEEDAKSINISTLLKKGSTS